MTLGSFVCRTQLPTPRPAGADALRPCHGKPAVGGTEWMIRRWYTAAGDAGSPVPDPVAIACTRDARPSVEKNSVDFVGMNQRGETGCRCRSQMRRVPEIPPAVARSAKSAERARTDTKP